MIHAVREVVAMREMGLQWVARTDIDDCFPSIAGRVVREKLMCCRRHLKFAAPSTSY